MKKLFISTLALAITVQVTKAQLFSRNFNSSTLITDYIDNATPANSKFNGIITTNSATATASITNQTLRLSRSANTSGTVRFSRTTDLLVSSTSLLAIKFSLNVSGNSVSKLSAASFVVGTNFTTNAGLDPDVNARFGINLSATNGNFSLRKFKPSATSSAEFNGTQQISYYINKTGSSKSYMCPNGSVENITNGTSDLWVGNTKVFDDTPEENDVAVSDFKLAFDGGSIAPFGIGNIDIDDILINELTTTLPVSLLHLNAKTNLHHINLSWQTASENNNSHFDILRATNQKNFVKIGEVKGIGTVQKEQTYLFTDIEPLPGINYYQLKQVDFDGTPTLSKVVSAKSNNSASYIKVITSNANTDAVIYAINSNQALLNIYEVSGKKVFQKQLSLSKGFNHVTLPIQTSGVYLATLAIGNEIISKKFIQ
jgi:hypothetical protein